ncbi:uncharacterized protein LOC129914885 [Episyrphus balteatus]|uniref:uncharacterized protein LOC129914885 n=1 Tax=Episyrphus balteatus TaxID=286459 RepID=UPI0024852849|nr:uncharacterized protein LOC129914885 [Episyrphus balteatus]
MDNKISFAKDLIKSSSVPELTIDLDNTPIESDNFDEYRKILDIQLPMLFDFIQQNEELLLSKEYNDDILEIKAKLLMLTTEITAHNTLYKIRNEQFLRVFNDFIQKNFYKILDDSEVEEYVLKHYTQYLKADNWKRHIGTVHGFSRFLELKVSNGRQLPTKWSSFSLSVGLTIRECHLPAYKELSTQIFQTIITYSVRNYLLGMKLFADDSLIYICGKNSEDMCEKLNDDLKRIDVWLKMNKLKVNVTKTKYMKFGMNEDIDVKMDSESLICVESIKYLGCVIDRKLNLKEHASHLSSSSYLICYSSKDPKEIKELNIPDVIFDAVLNSLRTVDSIDGTYAIWKCLCDCLDFKEDVDSYNWDVTDEMMENLLGSLKHANNSDIVICLFSFIPKILTRFTANRKEIEEFLARDYDSLSEEDFCKFRKECSKINSCASYRWALYIVKLFVAESYKLLESPKMCEKMLQQFHICYLTCLYTITVEVMNINLLKFFEQYSNILVEAIATHHGTRRIRELVVQIYQTFIDHLEKSDLEDVTKDFQPYHKAFKQFVEEPF